MTEKGEIVAGAYKWEITNYKQYQDDCEHEQFVQSPEFSIGPYSWHLRLYPRGKITYADTISLVAQSQCRKVMENFSFTITILDLEGTVLIQKSHDDKNEFDVGSCWNMSNMIKMCEKPVISLTDNKIIILCEIRIDNTNFYAKSVAYQSKRFQQLEKFEFLINNEDFSDVKFVVGSKHLYAHKVILASSSEVFAAMFKHKMKENAENVVEIEDLSYEVLHDLFRFIYSGIVPKIIGIVKELLIAADKYQISALKCICEQQLCDDLSINNAIDYLSFSDTHGAAELKNSAIIFIAKNMEKIIDLKEFDAFMTLDAAVVKDIFREVLSRNKQSSNSLNYETILKFRSLPRPLTYL